MKNNQTTIEKKPIGKRIFSHAYGIIVGTILTIFCASLLLILIWGVFTAFKDREDFFLNKLGLPKVFSFQNYVNTFHDLVEYRVIKGVKMEFNLFAMFLNTLLYAGGSALINTFTCCVTAYLCSKYKYKFSKFIHNLVVVVMIVPVVGNMPSMIVLLDNIGIYDSVWALWLQNFGFTSIYFLIFYSTFEALPWEYGESAFIDGASHTSVMFKIMIPLVMNTCYVMFLLTFVGYWNNYQTPMVYWKSGPNIATGMFSFLLDPTHIIPEHVACCIITIIPILVLFMIFKNKMMGNLTLGGLKG